MKKRITSLLLVMAMVLSMTMTVSFAAGEETTPVTYPPQACDGTHAEGEWTPLTTASIVTTSVTNAEGKTTTYRILPTGNYYVKEDVTFTNYIMVLGKVNICLNGHTITLKSTTGMGLFNLGQDKTGAAYGYTYEGANENSTLTICDHDPAQAGKICLDPSITGKYASAIRTSTTACNIYLQAGTITGFGGAGISMANGGNLDVQGGTITGNGLSAGDNSTNAKTNCGIYAKGIVTISGGTITGHSAPSGAGVYMADGKLNLTGGTISGNNATGANAGAGVYVAKGTFTMSGGSITGNTTTFKSDKSVITYGVGVYIKSGTFNLQGGTISNHSVKEGTSGLEVRGTVYPAGSGATFNMTGGTITGNNVTYGGGFMARNGSVSNLSGGTITGNTVTKQGGAIFAYETAEINISGDAAIYDNTASVAANGPNLFVYSASSTDKSYLTVTGGQIGSATDAYGIYFSKGGSQTSTPGAAISGNPVILGSTAGINGSIVPNLYLQGLTEGAFISTYKKAATTTDDTVSTTGNYSYRPAGYSSSQPGGYVYAAEVTAPGTYTLSDDMYLIGKATLDTAGEYVIDLNGHDLTGSASPYFTVSDGVKLTIKDSSTGTKGRVVGFKNDSGYEGLVKITDGGVFDLYDAIMTGRSATQHNAGAVRINAGGTFNMYSGTITGNTVPNSGGAVLVNSGAEFNMYGGTITKNHSKGTGSGVWGTGVMNIYGGTISENTTEHSNGGQVFIQDNDGEIGTLNVSGAPVISAVCTNSGSTVFHITKLEEGADIFSATPADTTDDTVKAETVEGGTRYTYQAYVPCAHTEKVAIGEAVAPTCSTTGMTAGEKCAACGETITAQVEIPVDANAHPADKLVDVDPTAPTCEGTGLTAGKKCEACGVFTVPQTPVDALGHDWDEGVITTEPTYEAEGVRTFTCKNDASHTKTEAVGKLSLGYDELVAAIRAAGTEPTTIKLYQDITYSNGYYDGKTLKIEAGQNITLDLNGYTLGQTVVDRGMSAAAIAVRAGAELTVMDSSAAGTGKISASNTAFQLEGKLNLVSGTIAIDNPSPYDLDPETGFAYGVWFYMRSATAPAPEFYMTGGAIDISDAMMAAHTPAGYANAVVFDEGADGVADYYDAAVVSITGGTVDGTVYVSEHAQNITVPEGVEVVRPVCKHTETEAVVEAKAATCTEPGTTAGEKCSACGTVITEPEAIPAKGHSYSNLTTTPATCTEDGWMTITCRNCSETFDSRYDEEFAEYVASMPPYITITPPTATGHDWDEGVITTEPTEDAEGVKTFTCKNDASHTKTEPVAKLDHTHKYESKVTEPTCTEEGYTTYTCACGHSYVDDKVPAKGHSYSKLTTTPATCTEDGWMTITCRNCSETFDSRYDEEFAEYVASMPPYITITPPTATGHDWDEGVITTEPTFDAPGVKTFTCKNDATHTYTEEIAQLKKDEPVNVEDFKAEGKVPVAEDGFFAGYYADADKTQAFTGNTGSAYVKFVAKQVLSVKCQVTAGTTAASESTDLRLLTTVDDLNYSKIGFKVTFGDKTVNVSSNKVFAKIVATTDGVAFEHAPSVFHEQSSYFMTYTITDIPAAQFGTTVTVVPYWVTLDGTEQEGVSLTFTLNEVIAKN